MRRMLKVLSVALACDAATGATAQSSTEQARAVAGDAPAAAERLTLIDEPRTTGPARALFNGRDLADWEGWLGYADRAVT